MLTVSPGWITCENMSVNPPIVFAMESFRPSEMARPPMPSAVNRLAGLTPNTGCSTMVSATTQTSTRAMLMKIDACGILLCSSTLRRPRLSKRVTTNANAMTMARKMILPLFAFNQSSTCSMRTSVACGGHHMRNLRTSAGTAQGGVARSNRVRCADSRRRWRCRDSSDRWATDDARCSANRAARRRCRRP